MQNGLKLIDVNKPYAKIIGRIVDEKISKKETTEDGLLVKEMEIQF